MSLIFSLPVRGALPKPSVFINKISSLWSEKDDCLELPMHEVVMVVCPQLESESDDRWETGRSFTFYLSNVSTRGLEVWVDKKNFFVRILTLSAYEEWDLAFDMLALAADSPDAMMTTDGHIKKLRVKDLHDAYNYQTIQEITFDWMARLIETIINNGADAEIQLPGPLNTFYVGRWLVDRILSQYPQPEENMHEIVELLFMLMRLVQYFFVRPQFSHYECAELIDTEDGELMGAVIRPETAFFVPAVDFLVLSDLHGGLISLEAEHFKESLGRFFEEPEEILWVDEKQFALQAISEERFAALVHFLEPVSNLIQAP